MNEADVAMHNQMRGHICHVKELSERHHGLDAVRGLCAIMVAVYHFLTWTKVATIDSLGIYGVYVFFILSSLTLCLVYSNKFGDSISRETLEDYFRNRFARIFPLLFFVSFLYFSLYVFVEKKELIIELTKFVFTSTGLFAFHAPGVLSNATGAWSLGIEIIFYFLFPILIMLIGQMGKIKLAALCFIFLLLQNMSIGLTLREGTMAENWGIYILFMSFGFYFISGFLLIKLQVKKRVTNMFFGMAVLAVCIFSSYFYELSADDLVIFPAGFVMPALIFLAIFLVRNSLTPLYLVGPFNFLGAISYSSYLLHPLVFQGTKRIAAAVALGDAAHMGIFMLCTLVAAYLSYRVVEVPLRDRLRAPRRGNSGATSKVSTFER